MNLHYLTQEKLYHHFLNLDYDNGSYYQSYEQQVNYSLNKIMNNFIEANKNLLSNNTTVVLEYNDDLLSLLSYLVLKNIKGVYDFPLVLYGRRFKTRKLFNVKKEKKVSKRFILKNNESIIFISCHNPIYKVKNKRIDSNILDNVYDLFKGFTYKQLLTIANFYGVNDKRLVKLNAEQIKINTFCDIDCFNPVNIDYEDFEDKIERSKEEDKLILFKYDKEDKDNCFAAFEKINNKNNIIYWYGKNENEIKSANFNSWVENKDNAPKLSNKNIITMDKEFKDNNLLVLIQLLANYDYRFEGSWTSEDIENFMETILEDKK